MGDPGEFAPADEKYVVEGRIGAGGMGEVLLVEDRDLRRLVAMKVLRPELVDAAAHRARFVAEAQATSQLEHPGIPPVHDVGVLPSGRVYFTMKLVRGRTLGEILRDLLLGIRAAKQEWTLHRLVTVLERVAEVVHFAHEKGVVHRDLKPDNIMLGEFGEVHVMDWGIAKLEGTDAGGSPDGAVSTAGTDPELRTQDGAIKGTIPYMSPEQAYGQAATLDRLSDVYALGAILYEILTLHPAFEGSGIETLLRVRRGEFVPAVERNPRRPVPDTLAGIAARAMAQDPQRRPPTALAVATELRAWLDGSAEAERRHREAGALADAGRAAAERYRGLTVDVARAEEAAEALVGAFRPWQSVDEKLPLLQARERVEELRTEHALAFAETVKLLEAAVVAEQGHAGARAALADLWRGRLEAAEGRGDRADTAYALAMIRRYDDGALAPVVSGDGTLELASDPPGAEVTLHRLVSRHGILAPDEGRALGPAPVGPLDLPMGSWLAILRMPGCRDVRYPVHVARNGEWRGRVRLRTDDEIGEDFVLVPAGPFPYGEGKERRRVDLPDFAIARYPVTFDEYGRFLDSLPSEAAEVRTPVTSTEGAWMERGPDGRFRPMAWLIDAEPHLPRYRRAYGDDFLCRLPVAAVTFDDAEAFCAWRSRETGREWRLPTEEEWEKAARGVDGRRFPWGDLEDASLAKCRDSWPEPAQPEPVGAFPTASSVYGMGDAAGGVWEWTDSWFDDQRVLRVLRGGAWNGGALLFRCAFRGRQEPPARDAAFGFRCARSLP